MDTPNAAAIIGLAGRFPKADNARAFWDVLQGTHPVVGPVPTGRQELRDWARKWQIGGGFLDDVARFDAGHFDLSSEEATAMDPQQRLFLETVWHAVEDAGYTPASMSRKTGVFVGAISGDYATLSEPHALEGTQPLRATDRYQIANRISYHFDLTGPSVTLDTACSSSAAALHMAVQALEFGDCDMAIVGGVNLFLHASRFAQFRQRGILSDDNICRPFRDGSNGAVYGEGIVAVVLRRADVAAEAGDTIRSRILGTAVRSAGKTQAFNIPSSKGQTMVARDALARAEVSAASISAVEAHGTGTTLGDPIEVRGLTDVFRADGVTAEDTPVSLSTLKGHFGHLESAAALAAVVKMTLQMEKRRLSPCLPHLPTNRMINFKRTPLVLQDEGQDWPQTEDHPLRRAIINCIGGGGVNASVVMEEAEADVSALTAPYAGIYVLSAPSEAQLQALAVQMAAVVASEGDALCPHRLASTLQTGRVAYDHRLAICAEDLGALAQGLRDFGQGKPNSDVLTGQAAADMPTQDTFSSATARAAYWVAGGNVDWAAGLSRCELPRSLPLPGFVFAGERYWLAMSKPAVTQTDELTPA